MKTLDDVMNELTRLKAESVRESNLHGFGQADQKIKIIDDLLNMFGVHFSYDWDDEKKEWFAVIK